MRYKILMLKVIPKEVCNNSLENTLVAALKNFVKFY